MIAAWADLELPIMNHRNQKDLWILGDLQDVITLCEDHSVTIATMMGSRFIHGIREKVELWEKKVNQARSRRFSLNHMRIPLKSRDSC